MDDPISWWFGDVAEAPIDCLTSETEIESPGGEPAPFPPILWYHPLELQMIEARSKRRTWHI